MSDILTLKETAEYLRVSGQTGYNNIESPSKLAAQVIAPDIAMIKCYLDLTEMDQKLYAEIDKMIKDRRIKAYKVGREWRFFRSDIMEYLESTSRNRILSTKDEEANKDKKE